VPIDSVGRAGGTELAPAAVREQGLPERIGARDRGDLDVRIRDDTRDPATGIVGAAEVLAVTAAVRDTIAAGERPLVLGGCCTLLPGEPGLRGVADWSRVASRRRIEPCVRFSRTRLTDIVHRCVVLASIASRWLT